MGGMLFSDLTAGIFLSQRRFQAGEIEGFLCQKSGRFPRLVWYQAVVRIILILIFSRIILPRSWFLLSLWL